jgi:regulator of cell morphogenesis and NO signaling
MTVQKENKIGEIVAQNFHAAGIFENMGLDFCCGGKKTISDACKEKGINLDSVINALSRIGEQNGMSSRYDKWELDFLIDYIINNHHSYVLNSVSTIEHHLDKVVSKHGEAHPEVVAIAGYFAEMKEELLAHMQKEEKMLFPYIKKMIFALRNTLEIPFPPFGSVENPVKVMESEHEKAGELAALINKLSGNYTPPASACNTYKVLYEELREFENDLHIHVHLENNILFPKALTLEKILQKRTELID